MSEVNLIGGFYEAKSLPFSAQDTVNWLPVPSTAEGARSPIKLRGLPGYSAFGDDTPSTEPLPGDVILLLNFNGTNGSTTALDSSVYGRAITAFGNAQLSTTVYKYGTAAADFDGSGDYFQVAASSDLGLGSGDFTICSWVYVNSTDGTGSAIGSRVGSTGNSTSEWSLLVGGSSGAINFSFTPFAGGTAYGLGTPNLPLDFDQWVHVAACRDGDVFRIYVNGVQQATRTESITLNNSASWPIRVGRSALNGGSDLDGSLDDFYVIKGTCQFPDGTTFSPPNYEVYV